jgi:copper transporter 1
MDHSNPDHGNDVCSMNMIFTWEWKNTCVVFRWWHIKTFSHFVVTFIAIVLLTASYEYLKHMFVQWETSNSGIVTGTTNSNSATVNRYKAKRAVGYGIQVAFSFWLMLVFMTYNGWLMIAVAVGAVVGNYFWGTAVNRSLSCH